MMIILPTAALPRETAMVDFVRSAHAVSCELGVAGSAVTMVLT
jgi:hypothetical protein